MYHKALRISVSKTCVQFQAISAFLLFLCYSLTTVSLLKITSTIGTEDTGNILDSSFSHPMCYIGKWKIDCLTLLGCFPSFSVHFSLGTGFGWKDPFADHRQHLQIADYGNMDIYHQNWPGWDLETVQMMTNCSNKIIRLPKQGTWKCRKIGCF